MRALGWLRKLLPAGGRRAEEEAALREELGLADPGPSPLHERHAPYASAEATEAAEEELDSFRPPRGPAP